MTEQFIWPMNETLKGSTAPDQSGSGINSNAEVFHIPQSSRNGTSPSDAI